MLKYFPPERASIRSIRTESAVLAKKFKLQCQVDRLYMQGPNWYIADIDSDTLRNLESPRRGLILFRYWLSQLTGRNGKNQLLRNFFFVRYKSSKYTSVAELARTMSRNQLPAARLVQDEPKCRWISDGAGTHYRSENKFQK